MHRAANRWKAVFTFLVVGVLCFIIGTFAFFPYTDLTPKRVDVLYYYSPPYEDQMVQINPFLTKLKS